MSDNSHGKFSMGDKSTYEFGKLFQTNLIDTYAYAKFANKSIAKNDPYTAIVSTLAPEGTLIQLQMLLLP